MNVESNFGTHGVGGYTRMEVVELAWSAGFFDGEGCVTLNQGYPVITISQVAREPLDRFYNAVGMIGKVHGPRIPKIGNQPIHTYQCNNRTEVLIIQSLLDPYLCTVKRDQFKSKIEQAKDLTKKRLTLPEVIEIKRLLVSGYAKEELAKQFGVSPHTIYHIVTGRTWNNV